MTNGHTATKPFLFVAGKPNAIQFKPNIQTLETSTKMSTAETQVSSLPMPPERYISNYTDENIRRNRAPRPPPPPSQHEVYSMFGIQYNNDEMIRSLESQNIKRLIPIHFDRRKELKKLNHSLLVNFLDLIDFLILNPDSPRRTEKVRNSNKTRINKLIS